MTARRLVLALAFFAAGGLGCTTLRRWSYLANQWLPANAVSVRTHVPQDGEIEHRPEWVIPYMRVVAARERLRLVPRLRQVGALNLFVASVGVDPTAVPPQGGENLCWVSVLAALLSLPSGEVHRIGTEGANTDTRITSVGMDRLLRHVGATQEEVIDFGYALVDHLLVGRPLLLGELLQDVGERPVLHLRVLDGMVFSLDAEGRVVVHALRVLDPADAVVRPRLLTARALGGAWFLTAIAGRRR